MKYQPFSVAISVYRSDNPVFFDRALESITDNQTIKPNEIVLVVDGPVTDEINGVIDKYSSKCNLKVIRLKTNMGLGNALKVATENCSNELIARMDSDDIAIENRFEQQLAYFRNDEKLDIVGGDITEFIDDESNIVTKRCVPLDDKAIKKYMRKRCAMNHVTVMFKKTAVLQSGGYLDWFWNEDYYLWIRMMINDKTFANTGTVLVNVRGGLDQFARRGGWKYYKSERGLQRLLLHKKVINIFRYCWNCAIRFFIQVLLPNKLRGFVFKKLARKKM